MRKLEQVKAKYNARRVADRKVDELVGVCRGLLADGELNSSEAAFLQDWLLRNQAYSERYPFNELYARLTSALIDGVVDHDEESDLLATLSYFVGGEWYDADSGVTSRSTALPFDEPAPLILFSEDAPFCVTGTFSFGPREMVISAIKVRGGRVDNTVLKRTRYLLIGEFASRDWIHSSYGRKIEQAIECRALGQEISIISEQQWAASL